MDTGKRRDWGGERGRVGGRERKERREGREEGGYGRRENIGERGRGGGKHT